MTDGVPGEYLADFVPAVAEYSDVLLGDGDVLDVRVGLPAALLYRRQHQEAVAIRREHRVLLDVQPGLLQSPLGVRLHSQRVMILPQINIWKSINDNEELLRDEMF